MVLPVRSMPALRAAMDLEGLVRRGAPQPGRNRLSRLARLANFHLRYRWRPVDKPIVFCQNMGATGSAFIVALMEANGIKPSVHEKNPDLDELGVAHWLGEVSDEFIRKILYATRRDVAFEANNRFFSITRQLAEVFPQAKFIFLHRDARDLIRSANNKVHGEEWAQRRRTARRYTSRLNGPPGATPFQRSCNYWNNINSRILTDMQGLPHVHLRFSDLISGRLDEVEEFIGRALPIRSLGRKVTSYKPMEEKAEGFPAHADWGRERQEEFESICGETMRLLGYDCPPPGGS